MHINNLFDEDILTIPKYYGTYGEAIVSLLFESKSMKQENWKHIYPALHENPQAFSNLLTFCLLTLICNNKAGELVENKLILRDYFKEHKEHGKSNIIGLLRHTSIDIQSLNKSLCLSNNIVPLHMSHIDRTSLADESSDDNNFEKIKKNAAHLLIENSLRTKEALSLISAENLYQAFPQFPNYETWSAIRDIHQQFYPDEHFDIEHLHSLTVDQYQNIEEYKKIYSKSSYFLRSSLDEIPIHPDSEIIKIFKIYQESQVEEFFELGNTIIKKQEKTTALNIIPIFEQLSEFLPTKELHKIHNYQKYMNRSSQILSSPIGNMYQINALEIIYRLKNSENPTSPISKNALELANKISKGIDILLENPIGKNNPFLQSISVFSSSSQIDKFFITLEPINDLPLEKHEQLLENFLTVFVDEFLFKKDKKNLQDKAVIFLENEFLQSLIPLKETTKLIKPIKF